MWDGGEWHVYIDLPGHGLIRAAVVDTIEMHYVAKETARADDVYVHFFHVMHQRAYWPDLARFVHGISNDIRNCGASLAKIDHFFQHREVIDTSAISRFVETEVEYLFGLCRSMLDLLHDVVSRVWAAVEWRDGRVKRKLSERLSRVMLDGDRPRTAEEIDAKYSVGPALAQFYAGHAPFFAALRRYRDNIYHHGHSAPSVLVLSHGFAIQRETEPFASLGVWNEEDYCARDHAALRPALAAVVLNTISACESFIHALEQTVLLPPEVAPGYRVFLRTPHGAALSALVS
jgi:hypothetical protein